MLEVVRLAAFRVFAQATSEELLEILQHGQLEQPPGHAAGYPKRRRLLIVVGVARQHRSALVVQAQSLNGERHSRAAKTVGHHSPHRFDRTGHSGCILGGSGHRVPFYLTVVVSWVM